MRSFRFTPLHYLVVFTLVGFIAVVLLFFAWDDFLPTEPVLRQADLEDRGIRTEEVLLSEDALVRLHGLDEQELVSLDFTWDRYFNYTYGFALDVPRVAMTRAECAVVNDLGEDMYVVADAPVSTHVFTYEGADVVMTAGDSYFVLQGEQRDVDAGSFFYATSCDELSVDYDVLGDLDSLVPDASVVQYVTPHWRIVAEIVSDRLALSDFIKERYGSGCGVGSLTPTEQDGVFAVEVLGDGKSLDTTLCPVNYATAVRYYPEGNKVIAWDLGQASTFVSEDGMSYDQHMVDSFRFLIREE